MADLVSGLIGTHVCGNLKQLPLLERGLNAQTLDILLEIDEVQGNKINGFWPLSQLGRNHPPYILV